MTYIWDNPLMRFPAGLDGLPAHDEIGAGQIVCEAGCIYRYHQIMPLCRGAAFASCVCQAPRVTVGRPPFVLD
jgi:hypothetical protein